MIQIIKSKKELARKYNVDVRVVDRWIDGGLKVFEANGRQLMFIEDEVDRFLRGKLIGKTSPDIMRLVNEIKGKH